MLTFSTSYLFYIVFVENIGDASLCVFKKISPLGSWQGWQPYDVPE